MSATPTGPIAVLGAGSWGTALAILLARNGHDVVLWHHRAEALAAMAAARCNTRYLPAVVFPDAVRLEADLGAVAECARDLLIVVPSGAFRSMMEALAPHLRSGQRLCWGTKGLEHGSRKLLHTVAAEIVGTAYPLAVISGPTFAGEVARGLPTAITVASEDAAFAQDIALWLHGECLRVYTSADIVGVQLGGATKNVLALAAGIADGLGFGANTRAALITRGLVELTRLGVACGGRRETFMGLAGLGDLVLTCTDDQSRNRRAGLALGHGEALEDVLSGIGQVVEGVRAAREVRALAREHGVEMPIAEQVYRVLYEGYAPRTAVDALLERSPKPEGP